MIGHSFNTITINVTGSYNPQKYKYLKMYKTVVSHLNNNNNNNQPFKNLTFSKCVLSVLTANQNTYQ